MTEGCWLLGMRQAEHLADWGINMMAMQKTEKITESGVALEPLSGPG